MKKSKIKLYFRDGSVNQQLRRLDKSPNSFGFLLSNWQKVLDAHKIANKVNKSVFNVPGLLTVTKEQFRDLCKDLRINKNSNVIEIYYNTSLKHLANIKIAESVEGEGA